jgi:hypothetical protein
MSEASDRTGASRDADESRSFYDTVDSDLASSDGQYGSDEEGSSSDGGGVLSGAGAQRHGGGFADDRSADGDAGSVAEDATDVEGEAEPGWADNSGR